MAKVEMIERNITQRTQHSFDLLDRVTVDELLQG